MRILSFWKRKARELRYQTLTLYFAYRNPQTPWYAKVFAGLVAAYAFSPIDLIPDFIPVLGYLDDLIIVPLGVLLTMRLIPKAVLETSRLQAEASLNENRPEFKYMAIVIVAMWLIVITWVVITMVRIVKDRFYYPLKIQAPYA
jgi:uncharacterized membrane protein YkvA (DUF1232 family)